MSSAAAFSFTCVCVFATELVTMYCVFVVFQGGFIRARMTTVFHAALKRSCGQEKSKSPYTFYPSIPSDLIPLRVSAGGGANLSLEEAEILQQILRVLVHEPH